MFTYARSKITEVLMNLLFYTDAPAADALFLKNGIGHSSGQPLGPACRALVRDPELCAKLRFSLYSPFVLA